MEIKCLTFLPMEIILSLHISPNSGFLLYRLPIRTIKCWVMPMSLRATHSFYFFLFYCSLFFKSILLKYSLYTIHWAHFKCIIWLLSNVHTYIKTTDSWDNVLVMTKSSQELGGGLIDGTASGLGLCSLWRPDVSWRIHF